MAKNDNDNGGVLTLRNFLTDGLGSRIITMMSADLDLTVSQRINALTLTVNHLVDVFFLLECVK
jgi:hypothetical protein